MHPHPVPGRRPLRPARGDDLCEENGVDYVFGLPGTKPLSRKVDETADAVRTERAVADLDVVRGFAETRHRAELLGQGAARHRPHRGDAARGSTSASSSLTSTAVHPNGSTRPSTALAARRKIS